METPLRVPLYEVEKQAKPSVVCVTGATGYIAGHIVERLLRAGHTVRATVRDPKKHEATGHLTSSPGWERLQLVKADLLEPGSFDEAVKGCDYVIHTASPFIANVAPRDVQKRLIVPAVQGTINVLEAVNRSPSVKRVVLTSSVAAIYGDADEGGVGHTFTEEDWNTTSSETVLPYSYSKTLAERKAWEMAKAQDRWQLVVINPSFVMGPLQSRSSATAESAQFMKRILRNEFALACPAMGIGFVDVRDVAAAHCVAMVHPEASGRYITCSRCSWIGDEVRALAERRPDLGVRRPGWRIPKWLLLLLAPLVGLPKDVIRHNVDKLPRLDASRIQQHLSIKFLDVHDTLVDMALCLKALKLA